MVLNNKSYVHKKVLYLIYSIQNETGLELRTDLTRNLYEVRFENDLSHIIIDFRNSTIFLLSVNLNERLKMMLDELMIYLSWLYQGEKFSTKNAQNF